MIEIMQKLLFIGQHYFFLFLCIFSFWGIGQCFVFKNEQRTFLTVILSLITGLGVVICALQAMAITGKLNELWILILLTSGILIAGLHCLKAPPQPINTFVAWWLSLSVSARGSVALFGLFLVSTLSMPLVPPLGGDEAMYHLPHARAWAESGKLDIHGWLRYPWFPFNFDLLFAAALLLYDDVFAHLLGALPGWICALLVFKFAQRFTGVIGASFASIFWIQLSRNEYAHAGADLSTALFVFGAYVAWQYAKEVKQKSHLVILSAFLLGVACGGKYQALSFVPLLILGIWFTDKRPSTILKSAFAFVLPCMYWYARNALLTGDPFQPMGGRLFGFTDWNLADYQAQFADLKVHADWPKWYLWSALSIPFFHTLRNTPIIMTGFGISAYSISFWIITSHYSRYLLPVYPLLCILSVSSWHAIFLKLKKWINPPHYVHVSVIKKWSWLAAFTFLIPLVFVTSTKNLKRISPTEASREVLFHNSIPSYDAISYVNKHPSKKIYQFGLDDAVYFSKKPLFGDVFGPWRFSDFVYLPADEFAQKLKSNDFDTFIIRGNTATTLEVDFEKYFLPIFSSNGVTVYHLKPTPR